MVKAKKWVLVKNFDGEPKEDDLQIEEEELPELETGDVLFEALWFTVDPYMRPYTNHMKPPITMIGQQLARVVQSKDGCYPLGSRFLCDFGWRTHTVYNPSKHKDESGTFGKPSIMPFPDIPDSMPESYSLGAVGMPGATAYFGLLKICDPKPGETVLVSGAAGAVGSMVGQIAKIKVIGYAGTDEKVKWLKELGFDFAFNYKKCNVSQTLKEAAPEGVDCYFDNVGGAFSNTVILNHMKKFGRVAVCGAVSSYNASEPPQGPELYKALIFQSLKLQGFLVYDFYKEHYDALAELTKWIKEGKITVREDVTVGFENMRSAFYGMLKGANTGKAVVKA